jgi:hypothetical protein
MDVQERSGRFFRVTVAASIGLHVAAGAFFVVASLWKIAKLSPKAQELIFQPLMSPSAAPEPAAGAPSAPAPDKHSTIEKATSRHDRVTQPTEQAARSVTPPVDAASGTDESNGAPAGGLGQGSDAVGSVVGVPDIGQVPVQVPPPAAPPPQMVERHEIEGQRIAGDPQVRLPDDIVAMLSGQDVAALSVSVRLCIDEHGAPSSIRFTPSTGFDRVDETIRIQMATWRYQPWRVNGQVMRVCFPVLFKYRITQ